MADESTTKPSRGTSGKGDRAAELDEDSELDKDSAAPAPGALHVKTEETGRSIGPTSGSTSTGGSVETEGLEASSHVTTARDAFEERLEKKMAQASSSGRQDDIDPPTKYKKAPPVLDSERKKALLTSDQQQDKLDQSIAAKVDQSGRSSGPSSGNSSSSGLAKSNVSGGASFASTASGATAALDAHAARMEDKMRRASQSDYLPHDSAGWTRSKASGAASYASTASGAASYASTASGATATRDAHAARTEDNQPLIKSDRDALRMLENTGVPGAYLIAGPGADNVNEAARGATEDEKHNEEEGGGADQEESLSSEEARVAAPQDSTRRGSSTQEFAEAIPPATSRAARTNTRYLGNSDVVHFEERRQTNVALEVNDYERGTTQEFSRAPFLNVRRFRGRRPRRVQNRESRRMVNSGNAQHGAPSNHLGNEGNGISGDDPFHEPTPRDGERDEERDIAILEADALPAAHEDASVDHTPIEAFTLSGTQRHLEETIRRHVLGNALHISERAVKTLDNDEDFVENEIQATNGSWFQKRRPRLLCSIALILLGLIAGGAIFGVIFAAVSLGSDDLGEEPESIPSRFELLKASLESTSSEADLSNWQSPQYRALSWLADEDVMNLTTLDGDKLIQRYIATIFFFSSVDSANFVLSENMVGDECTWNRALNHSRENEFSFGIPGGITCSEAGKIASINFGSHFRPLVGTFPREIGYLDQLQNITVFRNPGLTGTLPDSLILLKELIRVQFLENGLGGTIPSLTAQDLREVTIADTSHHGTIPSSIGNLTKLASLVLGGDLTGTIPEFVADLEHLNVLSLGETDSVGTRLVGSIPSLLGQNQDLYVVNFGNNVGNGTLNGTIPNGLLRSRNLRLLMLHGNRISGTIASVIGSMADLRVLSLHSNMLTSTIPTELGNTRSLEYLELGDNLLKGTVPQTLSDLVNLRSLSLAGNRDLSGDLNFLCNMQTSNSLTDCKKGNPDLVCFCCKCCHGSLRTCAEYPNG